MDTQSPDSHRFIQSIFEEILNNTQSYVKDYVLNNGKTHFRNYHIFTIPKKSGSRRVISAPVEGLLEIQSLLASILVRLYRPRKCVTGFVLGKSVADNARMHSGRNYVFNTDLQDFFPSISMGRVQKALMALQLTNQQAYDIARICCYYAPHSQHMVLPQGAPTSPVLSNMVCEGLDRKLSLLANEYKCRYSRYADDITFSSNHNIFIADGPFLIRFYEIIKEEGFRINENKTRLQTGSEHQEVTGLTTNRFPNVSKEYMRELRMLIHVFSKYGEQEAFKCYCRAHFGKLGKVDRTVPQIRHIIQGKLAFLKMVKGENDNTFKSLYGQYCRLCRSDYSENKFCLQSYTIEEFEKAFGTSIKIVRKHKRIHNRLNEKFLNERKNHLSFERDVTAKNNRADYYAYADIDGKREFLWFHHVAVFYINDHNLVNPDSDLLKRHDFVIDHWCKNNKTYWLIRVMDEEYIQKYSHIKNTTNHLLL